MAEKSVKRKANLLLKIGGMQCSFCVESIKKAFRRIEGVSHVGVNLSHEETLIEYDPTKATPAELRETIRSIGYSIRDPTKPKSFEEDEEELRRHRRQLSVTTLIGVLTLGFMALIWFGIKPAWFPWAILGLTLTMIFIVGGPILRMAYASLRRGILNQHVLMEFGALGGLFGGLIGFFVQPWPMADFMGAAIYITAYHILSGYISLLVRTNSSQAIRKLMNLQPATARVIRNGIEEEIPIEQVQTGDLVRVRPGESIPIDGLVKEGKSTIDQSLVTGESMPVIKEKGDEVIGGSLNQYGALVIETTKVGQDSFLQQVSRSIQEARALKPSILQTVEKVLKIFVPGVLLFAAFAFLLWTGGAWLVSGEVQFQTAIFTTLAVLVMGYPCALGMATPLAMIRGGGLAAQHGILMRSGEAFQVFKDVTVVALDKTGTITEGKPRVVTVYPMGGYDENEVISLAASIEQNSEHPLARAIMDYAHAKNYALTSNKIEDFEIKPGFGVIGSVGSSEVRVGSPRFLMEKGIALHHLKENIYTLEKEGQTVVGVAQGFNLIGLIGIADTLKPSAKEGILRMKRVGLESVMITGDNKRTAEAIAKQAGIDQVIAEVLPQEKAEQIRNLQKQGKRVAMVGDGINDAPALMQANVGIAIGAGTDIAIESADVILVHDNISGVVDAYEIGKTSYSKTKQNVGLAFSFNGIGVPLAVTGLLHPVFAMLAMAASVTTVLLNSFGGKILSNQEVTALEEEQGASVPEMGSISFSIPTIHCQGCVNGLTNALLKVSGINSVEGDSQTKTMVIAFNKESVTIKGIREVIEKRGHRIN
ncbi:MAG: heavy metal translocating P-type ATPase [Candidatus Thorarchaeota archaeon]